MNFKRTISLLMSILIIILSFAACGDKKDSDGKNSSGTSSKDTATDSTSDSSKEESDDTPAIIPKLNNISINEYTIVYDDNDVDYSKRAAEYISSEIEKRTEIKIPVKEDDEGPFQNEIVVGETTRQISKDLNANTTKTQFAIFSNNTHIALEANFFVIAAAAYFFVETYIPSSDFTSTVPNKVSVHDPIVKDAKNFILLIGDGMGPNQTLLFNSMDFHKTGIKAYSDGEDIFYGYLLPHQGEAKTNSRSGLTDSAASATALATGYKTINGYVGKSATKKNLQSITELAGSLGMATAVMSTEPSNGATPASFSAHANDRYESEEIAKTQSQLVEKYNTIIRCDYNYYTKSHMVIIEKAITETLDKLSENEKGFFLMYEEAYIDKHCHNNDMNAAFEAVVRFNQAIGRFMEYTFYNPDTFIMITADHETGGLTPDENGGFKYTSGDHTRANVPIFAYGSKSNVFNGVTIENTQIPMTIASMFGVNDFGDTGHYKSLLNQ